MTARRLGGGILRSNWLRLAIVAVAAGAYVWMLPGAFGLTGASGSDSYPYPYPYPYPYSSEAAVATSVRDAGGVDVTGGSVVVGTVVHDEASVSRGSGTPASVPEPTGAVDFTLFDNDACTGNVLATATVSLTNGFAGSPTYATGSAGAFSYWAYYEGDPNYQPQYGPCEPFGVVAQPRATQTAGYWKNHPDQVIGFLPVLLGSFAVSDGQTSTAVFDAMSCGKSKTADAAGCLAGQLLAATLNVKNGASNCIDPVIAQANALLVTVGYQGPSSALGTTLTSDQRKTALTLNDLLDRYNSGKRC
jgi:hypothetical protein